MKAPNSIGLAAGVLISLSTAANATPTLVGTTTDPTGINNLVVDGTTYDVTFSTTTLNSFTRGTTLSKDAASALAAALNTLSVTELANTARVNDEIDVDSVVVTPLNTNWDSAFCPACYLLGPGTWFRSGASGNWVLGFNRVLDTYVEAADFTAVPTGVPEPWTLGLFASGLGALGLLHWRRKRKAQAVA